MKKLAILTAIILLISGSAFQAAAADWNFYGSARVSTFITETDAPGGDTTTEFGHALHDNSRIGARVKVSDDLTGRFEYGAKGGEANLRHLYGEWNFGSGRLLIGQTISPLCWYYSNQAYNDKLMLSYGAVYGKRVPQIRLRFGGLKIAAITPGTDTLNATTGVVETTIPRMEVSYQFKLDRLTMDIGGGYNTYSLRDTGAGAGEEHDIRSYILALGGTLSVNQWYLRSSAWLGQNTGPYGMSNTTDTDPVLTASRDAVIDNDAYGIVTSAGMTLNDMFSFEAGVGYTEAERDEAGSHEDEVVSCYVQTTVTLAPGFFFVPEIGIIDNKTSMTGKEQDELFYYGIKWQVNF